MSDQQTAYINTYIDFAVDTAHSFLNDVLQLKTQLKMANDLLKQRDQVIAELQADKEKTLSNIENLSLAKDNARQWEERYHAMMNKTSHMDTLTSQYNKLKQDYVSITKERDKLKEEIDNLKNPKPAKKVINKKYTKSPEVNAVTPITDLKVDSSSKTENDDF